MMGGGDNKGGDNNAMAGLMQKSIECGAKAKEACAGECEWKPDDNGVEKCELSGKVAMQLMMGGGDNKGGDNNAMAGLMQKSIECGAKAKGACAGKCEWKPDDNGVEKCDLSVMVAMQLMMGGGDNKAMTGLMQKAMECNGKTTQASCDGECKWDADAEDKKCNIDEMAAMQAMCPGSVSGATRALAGLAALALVLRL